MDGASGNSAHRGRALGEHRSHDGGSVHRHRHRGHDVSRLTHNTGYRGRRERRPGGRRACLQQKQCRGLGPANVNGTYNGFSDDCTDFVSRALAQAGYPFSYTPSVIVTDSTNDHYWYYFTVKFGRHYSHSWSVAHDLYVHLVDVKAQRITSPKNAQPGDVIFANWKGTSSSGISHMGIITKMSKGFADHVALTVAEKCPLTYWLKQAPNVHVWI